MFLRSIAPANSLGSMADKLKPSPIKPEETDALMFL